MPISKSALIASRAAKTPNRRIQQRLSKEIIKVRAEPHPESGEAWLYKAGTNIRMGSRPITEDERQGTLKFDALIEPSKNEDTKAVLKKSKKSSAENVAGFFASDEGEKKQRTTATKITTGRTVMAQRLDSSIRTRKPVLPLRSARSNLAARPSRKSQSPNEDQVPR